MYVKIDCEGDHGMSQNNAHKTHGIYELLLDFILEFIMVPNGLFSLGCINILEENPPKTREIYNTELCAWKG